MKRWTAGVLLCVMCLTIGAGLAPAPARADPVTATYMSYQAYVAAMAAAGLSYGTTTYSTLKSRGMTDGEVVGLQSALLQYGILGKVSAGSDVCYGQLLATYVGMQARGTWAGFSTACAGAYQYGEYAWLHLLACGSALFAFQGAPTEGATGFDVSVASHLTAVQRGYLTGALLEPGTMYGRYYEDAAYIVGLLALPSGPIYATWDSGDSSAVNFRLVCSATGDTLCTAQLQTSATYGAYFTDNAAGTTARNAIMAYLTAHTVAGSGVAAPLVQPVPYVPGEMPDDPFPGDMPDDPIPGDPWEPVSVGPDMLPIPIGNWNDPPKVGTPGSTEPQSGPSPVTPGNPAPYAPPVGTNPTPIPSGGWPLPGKKAHDAAAALDAAVPDSLAWLKAPFIAILTWMGDLVDWLQGVWLWACGVVAGWVLPSDAGLAASWSVPWADLKAAAATRWPFCIGAVMGELWAVLTSPGAATHSLPLAFNLSLGGTTVGVNVADWLEPLQPYRWVGTSFAWVWLVVSLILSFRPRVVT